jgi:hypothetical protein
MLGTTCHAQSSLTFGKLRARFSPALSRCCLRTGRLPRAAAARRPPLLARRHARAMPAPVKSSFRAEHPLGAPAAASRRGARRALRRSLPVACGAARRGAARRGRRGSRACPHPECRARLTRRAASDKRQAEAARIRDKYPDRIPARARHARLRALPKADGPSVSAPFAGCRRLGHRGARGAQRRARHRQEEVRPLAARRGAAAPRCARVLAWPSEEPSLRVRPPGRRAAPRRQVPRALRPHRRPVRVRHSQAHQAEPGESNLHLHQQHPATDRRATLQAPNARARFASGNGRGRTGRELTEGRARRGRARACHCAGG